MPNQSSEHKRRWRPFRTASGHEPVRDFIQRLTDEDTISVVAAMKEVTDGGLLMARHVRGDMYEVRAEGPTQSFRILFAPEGRYGQVLLAFGRVLEEDTENPNARD